MVGWDALVLSGGIAPCCWIWVCFAHGYSTPLAWTSAGTAPDQVRDRL